MTVSIKASKNVLGHNGYSISITVSRRLPKVEYQRIVSCVEKITRTVDPYIHAERNPVSVKRSKRGKEGYVR